MRGGKREGSGNKPGIPIKLSQKKSITIRLPENTLRRLGEKPNSAIEIAVESWLVGQGEKIKQNLEIEDELRCCPFCGKKPYSHLSGYKIIHSKDCYFANYFDLGIQNLHPDVFKKWNNRK